MFDNGVGILETDPFDFGQEGTGIAEGCTDVLQFDTYYHRYFVAGSEWRRASKKRIFSFYEYVMNVLLLQCNGRMCCLLPGNDKRDF